MENNYFVIQYKPVNSSSWYDGRTVYDKDEALQLTMSIKEINMGAKDDYRILSSNREIIEV